MYAHCASVFVRRPSLREMFSLFMPSSHSSLRLDVMNSSQNCGRFMKECGSPGVRDTADTHVRYVASSGLMFLRVATWRKLLSYNGLTASLV